MRVTGLDDPSRWRVTSPDHAPAQIETRGPDLVIHTSIGTQSFVVEQY
jgi:hypothetical protein